MQCICSRRAALKSPLRGLPRSNRLTLSPSSMEIPPTLCCRLGARGVCRRSCGGKKSGAAVGNLAVGHRAAWRLSAQFGRNALRQAAHQSLAKAGDPAMRLALAANRLGAEAGGRVTLADAVKLSLHGLPSRRSRRSIPSAPLPPSRRASTSMLHWRSPASTRGSWAR